MLRRARQALQRVGRAQLGTFVGLKGRRIARSLLLLAQRTGVPALAPRQSTALLLRKLLTLRSCVAKVQVAQA